MSFGNLLITQALEKEVRQDFTQRRIEFAEQFFQKLVQFLLLERLHWRIDLARFNTIRVSLTRVETLGLAASTFGAEVLSKQTDRPVVGNAGYERFQFFHLF